MFDISHMEACRLQVASAFTTKRLRDLLDTYIPHLQNNYLLY